MVSDPLHFASDPLQPPPRSAHLFWAAGQPGAGTCQSAPPPRCALSLTFPCPLRLSRLYKAGFRNWVFCFFFFPSVKKKEDTDFFLKKENTVERNSSIPRLPLLFAFRLVPKSGHPLDQHPRKSPQLWQGEPPPAGRGPHMRAHGSM